MATRPCSCCGALITSDEWPRLPFVGLLDTEDGHPVLEMRNHSCGSTIARELPTATVSP